MKTYVLTPFGVREVQNTTTETILLNFYGPGQHETLQAAELMNLANPEEVIDLGAYETVTGKLIHAEQ